MTTGHIWNVDWETATIDVLNTILKVSNHFGVRVTGYWAQIAESDVSVNGKPFEKLSPMGHVYFAITPGYPEVLKQMVELLNGCMFQLTDRAWTLPMLAQLSCKELIIPPQDYRHKLWSKRSYLYGPKYLEECYDIANRHDAELVPWSNVKDWRGNRTENVRDLKRDIIQSYEQFDNMMVTNPGYYVSSSKGYGKATGKGGLSNPCAVNLPTTVFDYPKGTSKGPYGGNSQRYGLYGGPRKQDKSTYPPTWAKVLAMAPATDGDVGPPVRCTQETGIVRNGVAVPGPWSLDIELDPTTPASASLPTTRLSPVPDRVV